MALADSTEAAGTVVSHSRSDGSDFRTGLRDYLTYRDIGVFAATNGDFVAHVIRAVPGKTFEPQWHNHEVKFQLFFVIRGWAEFEYADIGVVRLNAGSSVYQPDRIRHRALRHSDDMEILEIVSPGEFATNLIEE